MPNNYFLYIFVYFNINIIYIIFILFFKYYDFNFNRNREIQEDLKARVQENLIRQKNIKDVINVRVLK